MADRLERIQRNFLWGSSEGSFKYSLVAYDKVYLPIEMGGLGIRNVVSFNQVLLGSGCGGMVMKLLIFGGGLYPLNMGRVISIKYGEGKGGWSTKVCRKTDGFGLWCSISEG